MKKIIILILAIANIATAQTLQKSLNFQVNSNDFEILKLIVKDYNTSIVRTNYEFKFVTNEVKNVVAQTNPVVVMSPQIETEKNQDGKIIGTKTNMIFATNYFVTYSTNIDYQITTTTNIGVATNGVWYDTAEQFYEARIKPLVDAYHTELIKTTIRDYLRVRISQCTNEAEKVKLQNILKNYE